MALLTIMAAIVGMGFGVYIYRLGHYDGQREMLLRFKRN